MCPKVEANFTPPPFYKAKRRYIKCLTADVAPDALSTATTPSVCKLVDFGKLLVDVCLLSCPVLLLLLDQLLVLGGLDYVWRLQHKAISHSVTDTHEVLMKRNIRQS